MKELDEKQLREAKIMQQEEELIYEQSKKQLKGIIELHHESHKRGFINGIVYAGNKILEQQKEAKK